MFKKPNFFIVGAAKAGTTSLYKYLQTHTDIYMSPIKEPHHFSTDIISSEFSDEYAKNVKFDSEEYFSCGPLQERHIAFVNKRDVYLKLFKPAKDEKVIGEISNGYLYSETAAKEILKFNNQSKIIIVLRNPVERAFSHWLMDMRSKGLDGKSFVECLDDDFMQVDKGWGKSHLYVELGMYYNQVKRYVDIFPKKQVLILTYEDFKSDNETFMTKIADFLQVVDFKGGGTSKHNAASIPRYPLFHKFLKSYVMHKLITLLFSPNKINYIKAIMNIPTKQLPILTDTERKKINKYFVSDTKRLEEFIGRDLSEWYK
jgi:hypothetical protein